MKNTENDREKGIVVFGTGDFSDIVSFILEKKQNRTIAAYTVDAKYKTQDQYNGKPLIAFETICDIYPSKQYSIVIGFIGKQMFNQRSAIVEKILELGYELENVIDSSAAVDTTNIGYGNIILANASIEAHCEVGNCNIIWQNVVMPHHNKVGSFNNLAPSVSLSGYSQVGSHCFVGNNVCVKNRVVIHDYAYIGAGSYVSKDVASEHVLVPHRSYELENKSGFDFL